jgi:hypothetical protein
MDDLINERDDPVVQRLEELIRELPMGDERNKYASYVWGFIDGVRYHPRYHKNALKAGNYPDAEGYRKGVDDGAAHRREVYGE